MIEELLPYPEIKQIGLSWLPEIPAHWDVRRNGRLFGVRKETGYPDLPILEVSLRSGVRVRDLENGARKQQIADRSQYQRALAGDIAYNMMRMWQGAVGVAPVDGLVSPAYVVVRPFEGIVAAYYAYLFRTLAYMREVEIYSRGIVPDRNRLYWEAFKQIHSIFPPPDEQRLIVRFLDWHGAETAKLIRNKKGIAALIDEERQVRIKGVVTRGLHPNVALKPAGITWLKDVPEGWEIKRLKQIAILRSGEGITAFEIEDKGEFPVYGGNGLRGYTSRHTHEGDFILIGRQGALCGNIHHVSGRFFASEHAIVVRPRERLALHWLGELLRVMNLNQYSIAAAQPGLSVERLEALKLPIPPIAEQEAIANECISCTMTLDAVERSVKREIGMLQEFRNRLICDVVFGQLDVRGIAAVLPEATENLEAFAGDGADAEEEITEPEIEEAAA